MKIPNRVQLFAIVLYAVLFAAALSITLYTGHAIRGNWQGALVDCLRIVPFIVVFAVNDLVLCPKLLFRERYGWYLAACLALVAVAVAGSALLKDAMTVMPAHHTPPPFAKHGGPPGPPRGDRALHFYLGQSIISLLLIGFNTGMKTFVRYASEKITRGERESQHLTTELAYLRNQISPHFLMNTLNNIHALVDIDRTRAQDAIVKLSRLMRYLLYESEPEKVALRKEVEFTESYIELMRLRYEGSNLDVTLEYPEAIGTVEVPPLLFVSFLENAFKHGIRNDKSFIYMKMEVAGSKLTFSVVNSLGDDSRSLDEASGIGMDNIRKRLAILYGKNYTLKTGTEGNSFRASLTIPL